MGFLKSGEFPSVDESLEGCLRGPAADVLALPGGARQEATAFLSASFHCRAPQFTWCFVAYKACSYMFSVHPSG